MCGWSGLIFNFSFRHMKEMDWYEVNVIGIDPAPAKGLSVFDGQDHQIPISDARRFLAEMKAKPDVLLCWDSPLTGPPRATIMGGEAEASAFTQRPIESFFSRREHEFKTPKGISVRGYSGCSHWAMSRSLIGLPRTGPFDTESAALPFDLISSNDRPTRGRYVVEVHPALALWLWCRDVRPEHANWEYKNDPLVLREVWDCLLAVQNMAEILNAPQPPDTDDILDARLAYALGRMWIEKADSVFLLGDLDHGTFLLPRVNGLNTAFENFVRTE